MFVSALGVTLSNVVYALAQKLKWICKWNFTCSFSAMGLRADHILVEIEPKIKAGRGLNNLKL